jgi:hypothetical protein
MNTALRSSHRLVKRSGSGLACDEDGVALGAVNLVSASADAGGVRRCAVRSPDEISNILRTAYGPQPTEVVLRLHRGLRRTAAWIEAGDVGRAGVEALMLRLPDLTPEAMLKLDEIADLEKRNAAWETEARIPAGQTGGGQWTAGDGPAATADTRPVQTAMIRRPQPALQPQPSPVSPCGPTADATSGSANDVHNDWRSLLTHVNTVAIPANGLGAAQDFALPKSIARLGSVGLLAYAASLLNDWDAAMAREQIANAIKRFGLDPNRPADVIAATAYVWSRYQLPVRIWEVPATGPGLDAASEAVMRFIMIHPGAFMSMNQNAYNQIVAAALGGLSDLNLESSARPQGVDPALQTRSETARKVIAINLLSGKWQAHHLVPVMTIGRYAYIFNLAIKDGWKTNLATNLIALPADENSQLSAGEALPIHNTNHPKYNTDTLARILLERGTHPAELTPLDAHAILQDVANFNRARILSGDYNPVMRVGR